MNQSLFLKVYFAILLCVTIVFWGVIFYLIPRGFEMTDNSLYLLSYRHYSDFTASISLFATVIKPLYDIGGKSIINLRILGLCVYLAVSIFSSIVIIEYFLKEQLSQVNKLYLYCIGLIINTAPVLQYHNFINTPNYNWLNHIALMIFLSGIIIWINKQYPKHSIYAPFIIMFGFGLSVLTKITTASLLPIVVLVLLCFNYQKIPRLFSLQHVFWGIIGTLLSLVLMFTQGKSIQTIIAEIQTSLAIQASQDSSYENIGSYLFTRSSDFFGLLYPIFTYGIKYSYILLIPIVIVLMLSFYIGSQKSDQTKMITIVNICLFLGWAINILLVTYLVDLFQVAIWSLRVVFITFIYMSIDIFTRKVIKLNNSTIILSSIKPSFGWGILIFFFAPIFSFVTESSFTVHTGWASYFYLLASIIFLINPESIKNIAIRYIAPIFMSGAIIYVMLSIAHVPYRQTISLFEMNTNVQIQYGEDNIIVGETMAHYAEDLQSNAQLSGYEAEDPIIDLTGNSLGSIIILDGRSYVLPWFPDDIGANKGVIITILSEWQLEDIERAWIITDSDSDLIAESQILETFNIDFSDYYEEVFDIERPYYAGSQTFWRPIND